MAAENQPVAEGSLSAARLTLAVKRARAEAGASAGLLLSEPIAVIGMACRFPGASATPAAFWELLAEGRSGIRSMPEARWKGVRDGLAPHLLLGGYLEGIDRFDAEFFGIAPREAHAIDPQQRLLLEVCWEALSDAGMAPSALNETATGAFIAIYNGDYLRMQFDKDAVIDAHTGVGAAHSVAAGRLSFLLNLRGPSLAVDTACSSSLVATHLAMQSLRRRECNVALVGASSLKLLPDEVRTFAQWGMLSQDGRAKTFDAGADGFVPGEGGAMIVLKRLSDAIAQGDTIRAVLRGSAVNHDGRSSVLTAPNGPAQEAVIREALLDSRLVAFDVSYVETHGTGTSLGDPIEIEALDAVYGVSGDVGSAAGASSQCVLGAVKTNIGHLEACAGLAGLIKVVLAFEHQEIPRNLNFETLNPQIRLGAESRLRLANERVAWPRMSRPRYAGLSSFGLGGTNAHLLLEEAPTMPRAATQDASAQLEYCLPISAHTLEGLERVTAAYRELLRRPGCDLAAVAGAAALHRDHGLFRIAVAAGTALEAAEKLERRFAERWSSDLAKTPGLRSTLATEGVRNRKNAFVFSGQGSVWKGMLDDLLSFPGAAKVFTSCEQMVQQSVGWSLREAAASEKMLADTARSQVVLFAVQMALVELLKSWGVMPEAAAGHSVGEIAAAVTCGALTLEQGVRLALERGRQMGMREDVSVDENRAGRMLAVTMSARDMAEFLGASQRAESWKAVEIAAMNSPQSTTLSGPKAALEAVVGVLQEQGVARRWLDIEYAFHSAAMERAAGALTAAPGLQDFRANTPKIALVSTVTGQPWRSQDGTAAYWGRGVREPVRFHAAVDELLQIGCETFVEIGPHPVLLRAVAECTAVKNGNTLPVDTVALMRRGHSARSSLMHAAALLYEDGAELKWRSIYPEAIGRVDLPAYPWNRERFWLQEPGPGSGLQKTERASRQALQNDESLLGHERSSAFPEMRIWEQSLSTESFGWIAEHCWRDRPILPFAAWMEMARQAAVAFHGEVDSRGLRLSRFAVHRPLQFETVEVAIQTLVTAKREVRIAAKIEGAWCECASGSWERIEGDEAAQQGQARVDLAAWRSRCPQVVPVDEIYEQLAGNGLTYGEAFRRLREVSRGTGAASGMAMGTIIIPGDLNATPQPDDPRLSPVLLDACLQVLQAAMDARYRDNAVLPVSLERYRVWRNAHQVFALAEIHSADEDGCLADLTIADAEGNLVAGLRGFRVRRVPATTVVPDAGTVAGAPAWRMNWLPDAAATEMEPAADTSLRKKQLTRWIVPASDVAAGFSGDVIAKDDRAGRWMRQLADRLTAEFGETRVSRQLRFESGPVSVVLAGERKRVTRMILEVVGHEQRYPGAVERLCVVTEAAIDTGRGERVDPEQSALLGLVRSLRAEFPGMYVTVMDLQGTDLSLNAVTLSAAESVAGQVAERLGKAGISEELALRNGRWLRAQLVPDEIERSAEARELIVGAPGLIESLHEQTYVPAEPAEDELQIAVRAHGLNFRDVLTTLGTYAGVAGALGAECAGIVVKAGRSGLASGTPVMAFAPASMRSIVNVPVKYAVAKPETMTFAEAATMPVAFLTAHYAFSRLANLKPGETVLIHSGAGGLGQAALQLARLSGATVIATAGSAARRAYLEEQGIAAVFDSRTNAFAERVLELTGGRGVDVVLNALSGDRIAAGFRALRVEGTFLEVGKRDILTPAEAAALRPDAAYWPFDLGEVAQRDPNLIAEMLSELMAWFAEDRLKPLPLQTYAFEDAREAFRTMAGARHVGKLVLVRPESEPADAGWEARWHTALREGTMLITGGTGALGLATAEWLLAQGANSLVLVSRSGGTAEVQERLLQLAAGRPVRVVIERADVANADQMKAVLERIRSSEHGRLRGIFHVAGETQDRLLADHTEESFARAMRTKVEGARILDLLTRDQDLAATVYYSSVAGLLGSAGQAAYAAANASLDGLAAARNACGLRTLSVNWGAWASGGMVERLSPEAARRLARNGARPMKPAAALATLQRALATGQASVAIAEVDWTSFLDPFAAASPAHGFFKRLLPQPSSQGKVPAAAGKPDVADPVAEEMRLIRTASKSERVLRMETFVRAAARKVLGLSQGRPMPTASPLQELGLDSLMALELRNVLSQAMEQPLSATLLFDSPSIRELSAHLLSRMDVDQPAAAPEKAVHTGADNELDLEALSESEAEALLLAELGSAEGGRRRG